MFTTNQVIGHRGAAAYAPENTIESFQYANVLGCRLVEFDVMLCADGELFVFHDEVLNRTSTGRGKFCLATTGDLQSLDAGSWFSKQFHGVKIPTFTDVLIWLAQSDMQANIEIKASADNVEQTTLAVIKQINRYWPSSKPLPLVSSFQHDALILCHNTAPAIPLGLLLDNWSEDWLTLAQKMNCFSVHLGRHITTTKRIQSIKQHGYKVCVYTVNSKRLASYLFARGIDAVFSDRPDLMSRTPFIIKILKKLFFQHKIMG